MTLSETLEKLYASEINVSISCFWDGGWDIKIGDDMNGWDAEETVDTLGEVSPWLIETVKRIYPDSEFSLSGNLVRFESPGKPEVVECSTGHQQPIRNRRVK